MLCVMIYDYVLVMIMVGLKWSDKMTLEEFRLNTYLKEISNAEYHFNL